MDEDAAEQRAATAAARARDGQGAAFVADRARERSARRLLTPIGNPALERLADLAARLLGAPTAQVSVLTDVQTVSAASGLEPGLRADAALADSLCAVAAVSGEPLVVTDASSDDRVAGAAPVTSGAIGSYLGVPLRGRDGVVVGVLCVFGPQPREWDAVDVGLLGELAASVLTELELSALAADLQTTRVRSELAVAAGGVGTFDWDLRSGELRWDARLLQIFGQDGDDVAGEVRSFVARVHPDDLPRVEQVLGQAVAECGPFEAEYRVQRPDGTTRWVRARGQAMAGEDGATARVLGAAYDTTASRHEDARVSRILESMTSAFFSLDREFRFSYVNAEAERILGRPRADLLGGSVWELFPDAVGSPFETHYRSVAGTGEPATFEAYYPPPLDAWYEVRAWPDPDGLSVYFLDVTAPRRARQDLEAASAAAAAAADRLRLIVTVSEDLTSTFDVQEAVARLAVHLVPAVADWCLVTLVDEQGGLRDVGCHHADPALRDVVRAYRDSRLSALSANSYLYRVLRTARPVGVATGATEEITRALAPQSPARALIERLSPEAFECVPLRARGRTVGLITLFHGAARGELSREDLLLATEIADRAGLALDNARLYQAQHRMSEGLQRSLLTAPVQPENARVVVRYQPAATAARVGGDWHDAFRTPDGATVLVIGDVMGHDIVAAADMSQVRSLLRGIAYATGAGPAAVLSELDAAMQGLAVDTTASVVVGRLEEDRDGTRFRWANAGHPPPLVLTPAGRVAALTGAAPELLLGIEPSTARSDTVVTLEPGSTLLMFTDGLVERRDRPLDEGLLVLEGVVADLGSATLDGVVDEVLRRMLPGAPEDDVALVAVRLQPVRP